jgi:hypothetical protein
MYVSCMFLGATTNSTIVKFYEAIWELMKGIYSTRQFKIYKDHDTTVIELGLYFICDGGYPKMKCLTPPSSGVRLVPQKMCGLLKLNHRAKMLRAHLGF